MSQNAPNEPEFLLYHLGLLVNDEEYTLRFPIPNNWETDESNEEDDEMGTILTPFGGDFNETDSFISIETHFNEDNANASVESTLSTLEEIFIEDGWKKDAHLSALKTYDNRSLTVLAVEDKEVEYARKNMLIPLSEDPRMILMIAFQVNHLEKKYGEFLFPIFEALIRSCKLTKSDIDAKENQQYTKDLVEKIDVLAYFSGGG